MEKDEPVPMNALVAVTRPWMVREMAIRSCLKWIEELERQDRRFPHSPILALHIVRWYELYANLNMPEFSAQEPEWIAKYLKWSEIMVQRNPCHADMRMFYTNSLIWKLLEAYGTEKDALPAKIEEEYETILQLSPITPQHRHMYAGALDQLADNATKQGLETDAAAYREKAQKLRDAVKILEEQRREAHLYQ